MSKRVSKNYIIHNRTAKTERVKSEDDEEFSRALEEWMDKNR